MDFVTSENFNFYIGLGQRRQTATNRYARNTLLTKLITFMVTDLRKPWARQGRLEQPSPVVVVTAPKGPAGLTLNAIALNQKIYVLGASGRAVIHHEPTDPNGRG